MNNFSRMTLMVLIAVTSSAFAQEKAKTLEDLRALPKIAEQKTTDAEGNVQTIASSYYYLIQSLKELQSIDLQQPVTCKKDENSSQGILTFTGTYIIKNNLRELVVYKYIEIGRKGWDDDRRLVQAMDDFTNLSVQKSQPIKDYISLKFYHVADCNNAASLMRLKGIDGLAEAYANAGIDSPANIFEARNYSDYAADGAVIAESLSQDLK